MAITPTQQRQFDRTKMHMDTILKRAHEESRELSEDENQAVAGDEKVLADLERNEGLSAAMDALSGGKDFNRLSGNGNRMVLTSMVTRQSLGAQFISHPEIAAWLKNPNLRGTGSWRSPSIELMAATLTEDPASGGSLVVPQYLPGVLPTPQRPIVMSELFASGPTNSNAITYMQEKVFTNLAAPVAEGGEKPESTLTFEAKTSKVEKIAHWLPVSDELLEDEPAMRAYIDARLRLGVLLALDNQLLNGTGVSPQLLGLLVRTDLTPALPVGTNTSLDAIAMQIAAVEQASGLPVDGIVLNGADWLKLAMTKNADEDYLGRSPFEAPLAPTLWGRAVALTLGMPVGKALVGSFKSGGGQLFERGGMRVEASNSHADYFIKNLVAIRAEIRVALALFRPQAYGLVTGLNPTTP